MKIKILRALITCSLLIASINSNAQGGTLTLNGSVSGNLSTGNTDVWNITTNADGLLRLTFTTVSPADLDVTLYDNDGSTNLSATTQSINNSTVIVSTEGLSPGIYHVKITPHSSTDFGSYTLFDSLFTSSIANDAEPDGTAATAIAVSVAGSKTGHVGYYYNHQRDTADWYKVTTTADGLLRIYLATARGSKYSNNFMDINLTLYDNDGTTALGFVQVYDFNLGGPAKDSITADGLAPGTYYIQVQSRNNTNFEDYTISDSLFTPLLANDAEPNGGAATAIILPLAGSKTGHVGYYYNNQRDSMDWYKVTTTADGLLRVYLTTARGSVYSNNFLDVDLTLYDNDGTTALGTVEVYDGIGNPTTKFVTADGLAPGTYYIKVKSRVTA
ncbi:MAG: pre-peptidase C-terminal domain-containing protein, partial [Ferruginibacter sp.]